MTADAIDRCYLARGPVMRDITPPPCPQAAVPSKEDQNLLARMGDARIVFDALANDAGRAEPWGLLTLVDLAAENLAQAVREKDMHQADEASVVMAGAIALAASVRACDVAGEMLLLSPAISLIEQTKTDLDGWIRAANEAAP